MYSSLSENSPARLAFGFRASHNSLVYPYLVALTVFSSSSGQMPENYLSAPLGTLVPAKSYQYFNGPILLGITEKKKSKLKSRFKTNVPWRRQAEESAEDLSREWGPSESPPFWKMYGVATGLSLISAVVSAGMSASSGGWLAALGSSRNSGHAATAGVSWALAAEKMVFLYPLMGTIGAYFTARMEGYELTSFAKPYLLTLGTTVAGAGLITLISFGAKSGIFGAVAAVALIVLQPLIATAWVTFFVAGEPEPEEGSSATFAPEPNTHSHLEPDNSLSLSLRF